MINLEVIFGDTEQFLVAVRSPMSPGLFRDNIRNLEGKIRQLADQAVARKVTVALEFVSRWDYVDTRNSAVMKNVIIPEIETLLTVITDQLQQSRTAGQQMIEKPAGVANNLTP